VKEKVLVQDLRLGMYVSELDRPWIDTPFLFQGFHIESHDEIEELKRYCKYVYISAPNEDEQIEDLFSVAPIYQDKTSVEQELGTAKTIHARARELMSNFIQAAREGGELSVTSAEVVVNGMVDSMIRNPDALLLLTRLKDKDSYTYGRAIDVSFICWRSDGILVSRKIN
jgi:hypothetical protein